MFSPGERERLYDKSNEFQQGTYRALMAGSADAHQQRAAASGIALDNALRATVRRELTRLYDTLAAINDAIEVGEDGYARFGCLNDRDRFREIVQELEGDALTYHGEHIQQQA